MEEEDPESSCISPSMHVRPRIYIAHLPTHLLTYRHIYIHPSDFKSAALSLSATLRLSNAGGVANTADAFVVSACVYVYSMAPGSVHVLIYYRHPPFVLKYTTCIHTPDR